ncbi:MAG: isoleucine--tRNA ligase [Bacillota bacterium]
MQKFRELSGQPVAAREESTSNYWDSIDLLQQTVTSREGNQPFVFYEGPPTANGRPGIHHVISRTLKDAVCKYQTMNGYQVKRKAGWDTHGLPVEIEVEKQLKLSSKQEIEDYGIDRFNEQCRHSVFTYEKAWRDMSRKMGYLLDMENPYITLDNNYIESVWWLLNRFFQEGLLYEGHKILPYCPRCGTGLASHEVAQGYKEIKSNTVIVPFKRKDADNEYFLAWTTTPWTLASNVCLCVNPNVTYAKAEQNGKVYILAENLLEQVLGEDYRVVDRVQGKNLERVQYEQLMPFLTPDKPAFFVTVADFVTTEDGTGIVHMAPAFGEDDYQVGQRYGLPVLNPVDTTGKYTDTPWKGMFVIDADVEIIKWLHAEGKLYSKQRMEHNYPHCWRCSTPLLYYAKPGWYIEMTKLKDQLIANNNSVEWYPPFVGEKRFGNWLENLNDWALSRTRYWGTPLNIWRCDCGHVDSVGSRQELMERAVEKIDADLDLHRPHIDRVHLKCTQCGGEMTRVPDVIDCWFDSGAMPFAQYHYPFENQELFAEQFPADFICEAIDQTRGWFYSLLAISTFITGKSPYKRVLVNDLILDKEGKKMSKSRGNTVDPFELFERYGADAVRWYLLHTSPSWVPTRFDEEGLKETASKFFGTLRNVYAFFVLYANTDGLDPREFDVPYGERPELDRWILSKYNSLIQGVREAMAAYDLTRAVRRIQEFVIEDLSNWYIRRARRRFWASELDDDKRAVYSTTYEVLAGVCRLMAPFAPFLAEEIYRNLTDGPSVHLAEFPVAAEELLDGNVEERMDLARDLVGLGRAAREQVRIKVRQPLQKILVDGKYQELLSGGLVPLIEEELNIKQAEFVNNLSEYMDYRLKPNFRVAGPKLGPKIKLLSGVLAKMNGAEVASRLEAGETIKVTLGDSEVELDQEMVDVAISAREGFTVAMDKGRFVILDTTLTQELIDEGLAREFISKVQQLRKRNDYQLTDEISITFDGDDEVAAAVEAFAEYIRQETLARSIQRVTDPSLGQQDLNGHLTGIKTERL